MFKFMMNVSLSTLALTVGCNAASGDMTFSGVKSATGEGRYCDLRFTAVNETVSAETAALPIGRQLGTAIYGEINSEFEMFPELRVSEGLGTFTIVNGNQPQHAVFMFLKKAKSCGYYTRQPVPIGFKYLGYFDTEDEVFTVYGLTSNDNVEWNVINTEMAPFAQFDFNYRL